MTTSATAPSWLTVTQAAAEAQLHEMTVYKRLQSGEIHGHQRTRKGRWSVHRSALDAHLSGREGRLFCPCTAHIRSNVA